MDLRGLPLIDDRAIDRIEAPPAKPRPRSTRAAAAATATTTDDDDSTSGGSGSDSGGVRNGNDNMSGSSNNSNGTSSSSSDSGNGSDFSLVYLNVAYCTGVTADRIRRLRQRRGRTLLVVSGHNKEEEETNGEARAGLELDGLYPVY